MFVLACSLMGSLIPQGRSFQWYLQNYPSAGKTILALGFDNLFHTWYFIFLIILACVNIFSCCIIRLKTLLKTGKDLFQTAENAQGGHTIGAKAAEDLGNYLALRHYRQYKTEKTAIFYKNIPGRYGSFLVHLSLLFILVFGGLVLGMADVADYNIMPGESLAFDNGMVLKLENFRITDEAGKTDYASVIQVTAQDGASVSRTISVNYPLTFRSFKYYQHNYGTAGSVTASNAETGGSDVFYLTEQSFLSGDGRNGVMYMTLFPGYVEDENGNIIPVTVRGNIFPNPVYHVLISDEGTMTAKMVLPGETIQTGDISFTFNEPVNFPGIRIKHIPNPFPGLLYGSFVLMIVGFWMCFFYVPTVVTIRSDSYIISGSKTIEEQLMIDTFLNGLDKKEMS